MAQREKNRVDLESKKILEGIEVATKGKEPVKEKKQEKKKEKKKEEKKTTTVKKESWWHGVKSEFKKVRWPSKKEMVKYSIATITFILFFGLFFFAIEGIIYLISTL